MKNGAPSPSLLVDPFRNEEVGANGGTSRSNFGSSSNSSPEPQEGTGTAEAPFQGDQVSLELLPPPGSDLVRYFQGLGPPPEFQVTLNFWEESPGPSRTPKSLITVQMEQAFERDSFSTLLACLPR